MSIGFTNPRCDCRSYNRPELTGGSTDEVVLPSPAWGDRRNGVPVDACIADTILALWAEGVETIGSCCGHNGVFGPPTVILNDGVDAEWVLGLLPRLDPSRGWVVKQWQLTTTFRVRDR